MDPPSFSLGVQKGEETLAVVLQALQVGSKKKSFKVFSLSHIPDIYRKFYTTLHIPLFYVVGIKKVFFFSWGYTYPQKVYEKGPKVSGKSRWILFPPLILYKSFSFFLVIRTYKRIYNASFGF